MSVAADWSSAQHDGESLRRLEAAVLPPATPDHDHLVWAEAQGSTITTVEGRRVIDFTSGVLITNVGHSHPHVTEAIASQSHRGLSTFLAPHPLRATYALRILEQLGDGFDRVAFMSSGAEAVDAAVRIARIATGRSTVVTFVDSYHGKTTSTAVLSGLPSARPQEGEPDEHVIHVPYPDTLRPPLGLAPERVSAGVLAAIRSRLQAEPGPGPACIVFEPYLGSGGAIAAPQGFAAGLRSLADEFGALLIYDEVQSGFGRTGPLFAFQGDDVRPDLIALAKGIASGVPMAVVAGRAELLTAPRPGTLWNSFGGNPLACAAAHATLDILTSPALPARVRELSQHLVASVESWNLPHLAAVRGRGLSLGLDIVTDRATLEPDPERASRFVRRAGLEGVAVLSAAGSARNIVRIAPPLLISDAEYATGLAALERAASAILT